jgi:hypothetical protein
MLSTTINAAEYAQNCPKLPKFAKIYPKTISLRNFEMPPKIEIFVFLKKKKFLCVEEALEYVLTIWIFKKIKFICLFYCPKTAFVCFIVKKPPLYVNFSIPPCRK